MNTNPHRAIPGRIAAHLRQRWHRDYARGKLRFDPAYAEVAALLGDSADGLLDVGCGIGLLGFYLRERGFRGSYHGVDFDAKKIAAARQVAGHYEDLHFATGDANALPAFCGHVALLDVLHYLHRAEQHRLLQAAAERVTPGAVLIVRNVLRDAGWRFRATVVEEKILYATRWMCSPAQHYPSREEIEEPLRAAGLGVEVRPLWGVTPYNSFVIVARRP